MEATKRMEHQERHLEMILTGCARRSHRSKPPQPTPPRAILESCLRISDYRSGKRFASMRAMVELAFRLQAYITAPLSSSRERACNHWHNGGGHLPHLTPQITQQRLTPHQASCYCLVFLRVFWRRRGVC